jgi:hypothetical protein
MFAHIGLALRSAALISLICLGLGSTGGAGAQPTSAVSGVSDAAAQRTIVVVREPQPIPSPRWLIERRLREEILQRQNQPGLIEFTQAIAHPDGRPTGVYVWHDAASARAFVSRVESDWEKRNHATAWERPSPHDTIGPRWFEREEAERARGAPDVRSFQVVSTIDNMLDARAKHDRSAGVATVVLLSVQPGNGRARLLRKLEEKGGSRVVQPGLLHSYVVVDQQGRTGGIYFWKDVAAAQTSLNAEWKDELQRAVGVDTTIERYDIVALGSNVAPLSGLRW